jgi:hypothetical protein
MLLPLLIRFQGHGTVPLRDCRLGNAPHIGAARKGRRIFGVGTVQVECIAFVRSTAERLPRESSWNHGAEFLFIGSLFRLTDCILPA